MRTAHPHFFNQMTTLHGLIMVCTGAYILASALPFVPGAEIGLGSSRLAVDVLLDVALGHRLVDRIGRVGRQVEIALDRVDVAVEPQGAATDTLVLDGVPESIAMTLEKCAESASVRWPWPQPTSTTVQSWGTSEAISSWRLSIRAAAVPLRLRRATSPMRSTYSADAMY